MRTLQDLDVGAHGVSIDTRTLEKGNIYFALKREKDGHDFIPEAIKKGASALVVDHPVHTAVPEIIVPNTLKALGELAHRWRMKFSIPLIALTGSCGKTTTKEMIATILREQGEVLASEGNFNNAYGLPLMLLRLRPQHRFAVLEMGTNSPGEIAYIAEIAAPTVALITNIGASHLEKLESFEGVSKEKSDIFNALPDSGIAILNQDEPFSTSWLSKIGRRQRVTYGLSHPADISAVNVHFNKKGVNFDLKTPLGVQPVAVPLPGQHMVMNAVAAAASALSVGATLENVAKGLAKLQPIDGRFKPITLHNGCLIVDDAYNASVTSVKNAIDTLSHFKGTRIFVMTNMGELGEHAQHYHEQMGEWCRDAAFDQIFFFGHKALLDFTLALCPKAQYFSNKAELIQALKPLRQPHTMILIKGANSNGMDEVVNALADEAPV